MISIGEIRKTITLYYDSARGRMDTKFRPALVIAQADSDDYIVLPISRITRPANRDPVFDIKVDPTDFPLLNLKEVSYVRTHKQTVIHRAEIGGLIGVLNTNYEELYLQILEARELFNQEITDQALR